METRFGQKKAGSTEKVYVHMLNATLCATERTICCILENYQTNEVTPRPELSVHIYTHARYIHIYAHIHTQHTCAHCCTAGRDGS